MDHFYQNIDGWADGWFGFKDLYFNAVKNATNGSHFVEVGAWLGCSTAYMAVEIANSGKKIRFDVIDTWRGSPTEPLLFKNKLESNNYCVYDLFIENMKNGGVLDYINPIKMDSVSAAKLYKNSSLDFVLIDAAHGYDCVKADLLAWLPKIKPGKILAGDDYILYPTVKQAVDDVLKKVTVLPYGNKKKNGAFLYRKPITLA